MQKIARTAGATNNVDQCATTCHAPTVAGLATLVRLGRHDQLDRRDQGRRDAVHHRLQPDRGASDHRPGDEEGAAARGQDGRVRPAHDLDGRARRHPHPAQARHGQHAHQRDDEAHHRAGPARPGVHRGALRGLRRLPREPRGLHVEEAAEVCGVDADDIRRAAEMYAEGSPRPSSTRSASPSTPAAPRTSRTWPTWPCSAARSASPPAASTRCAARTTCRAAATWAPCHSVFPATRRSPTRQVRQKFAKAWDVEIPTNKGGRITDFIEAADEGSAQGLLRLRRGPGRRRAQPDQGHRQPREAGVPGWSRRSS